MTRADVIKLFPDATDEQITAVLNAHHKEIDAEKEKAKELKDNASKVAELQAQIEELNNRDLPDVEKIQQQLDKLKGDYEKAQKTIKDMELKNSLLGQGISEEDAQNLVTAMSAEKFDASVIGTVIANAISAHDKEKLLGTPDPAGKPGEFDKTSDAEKIAKAMFEKTSGNSEKSVISNYL